MDSRDFNQEPNKVDNQKYLEEIYNLQMYLVNEYSKIEGNVAPPININTKKSQVLLKDFTGRVIEELAEGYESLALVDELMKKNQYYQGMNYSASDIVQIMNHLQNAGEEMADAMHFMVELLIYANIQPDDISRYVDKFIQISDETKIFSTNTIAKCMIKGSSDIRVMYPGIELYPIINLWELYNSLEEELDSDIPKLKDARLYKCGHRYNYHLYFQFKSLMWNITYHLNIARNFLKNKPWKQSQMMTNEEGYQEELVKGFICMMGLFHTMGIDDENLYFLYFRKNLVNRFRIKSNY